jgi:hypothetical protein
MSKYLDPNTDKFINKDSKFETLFGRHGEPVLNKKETAMSKTVSDKFGEEDPRESHYVQTFQGGLYDPNGMYSHRESSIELKMSRVTKNTFDFYMLYLKTKNSLYLTRAQRSFLND